MRHMPNAESDRSKQQNVAIRTTDSISSNMQWRRKVFESGGWWPRSGAKRRKKFFGRALHFSGSKSTITVVVLVSAFVMYRSLVIFSFAVIQCPPVCCYTVPPVHSHL